MTPTTDQAAREAAQKLANKLNDVTRSRDVFRIEMEQTIKNAITAALAEREAECVREREKTKRACELWADTDTQIREILAKCGIKHDEDQPEATLHVVDGVEQLAAETERLRSELKDARRENECHIQELSSVKAENAALREQVEKMKRDGEILNALQAEWRFQLGDGWAHRASVAVHMGEDIRQAITAARGERE